jgi:hypothetical protein
MISVSHWKFSTSSLTSTLSVMNTYSLPKNLGGIKLVPVAVFGELAQVGLQLIKILHGDGYL